MELKNYDNIRISVIMPCRDEEGTVGSCVDEARSFLEEYDPAGEVIVVDNCSTDNSAALALDHGARLIEESRIGYGYAIRCGLFEAAGSVIFIIDCDMTYDVADMENMLKLIDDGYDMVIGDRLSGVIEKGAMPLVHRIGVRILSKLAAARFHVEVNDFHCGIRACSTVEAGSEMRRDGVCNRDDSGGLECRPSHSADPCQVKKVFCRKTLQTTGHTRWFQASHIYYRRTYPGAGCQLILRLICEGK